MCIVKYLVSRDEAVPAKYFVLNNISNFEALVRKSIFAFTILSTHLTNAKNSLNLYNPKVSCYSRHYLESLDRQVVHLGLGYFILFILLFYK